MLVELLRRPQSVAEPVGDLPECLEVHGLGPAAPLATASRRLQPQCRREAFVLDEQRVHQLVTALDQLPHCLAPIGELLLDRSRQGGVLGKDQELVELPAHVFAANQDRMGQPVAHEMAQRGPRPPIELTEKSDRLAEGGQFLGAPAVRRLVWRVSHGTTLMCVISGSGDPQLHTHCLLPNLVRRKSDGRYVALDAGPLFDWCRAAGSIYQNELQRSLSLLLGVAWGPDRNNTCELLGFSREQLRAFSKRSAQVEAELEAKGALYQSPALRMQADDEASLATRTKKDHSLTPACSRAAGVKRPPRSAWPRAPLWRGRPAGRSRP